MMNRKMVCWLHIRRPSPLAVVLCRTRYLPKQGQA
ncbi:hypothetical protein LINPERHAP2_LOCUS38080 [Linum perenne]